MHDLQCWPESEVNIRRKTVIKIPELKNWAIQKERETTTTQQTESSVRLKNSLAREKEALNSRFKGTQTLKNAYNRKPEKVGEVATKVKGRKTFDQKHKQ